MKNNVQESKRRFHDNFAKCEIRSLGIWIREPRIKMLDPDPYVSNTVSKRYAICTTVFILMKNNIKQHYRTNQELKESKKSCLYVVFLLEQPISLPRYVTISSLFMNANLIQHFWHIIFIQLAKIAGIEKNFQTRIWGFNINI